MGFPQARSSQAENTRGSEATTMKLDNRRVAAAFLGGSLLVAGCTSGDAPVTEPTASTSAPFALEEATIDGIHAAIKSGEITCQGVVRAYVERARAYNGICTALVTP